MALFGWLGFGRKKNNKEEKPKFNIKLLENALPFKCKVLGREGKYIVSFYLSKVDRWVNNIVFVNGNQVYISHEPEDERVKVEAHFSGEPLELTFEARDTWDLISRFAQFYEKLCRLYKTLNKKRLTTLEEQFLINLKKLRVEKNPFLCAKLFKLLKEIKKDDEEHYKRLRKRLLKECDRILNQTLDGVQKS